MKTIERYIQFAIDNWYEKTLGYGFELSSKNEHNISVYLNSNWIRESYNIVQLITSKPYIEAIAKGLVKKYNWQTIDWMFWYWAWEFDDSLNIELEVDEITTNQAIAIRNNTLEEFIENLLPKI